MVSVQFKNLVYLHGLFNSNRDTVASVGIIPKRLPFTKSNTAIKIFRHALSLDEHRAKFKANTYNRTTKEEAARGDFVVPDDVKEEINLLNQVPNGNADSNTDKTKAPDSTTPPMSAHSETQHSGHNSHTILGEIKDAAWHSANAVRRVGKEVSRSHHPEEEVDPDVKERKKKLESLYTDRSKPTDVLEVWFSGCHCGKISLFDVGLASTFDRYWWRIGRQQYEE